MKAKKTKEVSDYAINFCEDQLIEAVTKMFMENEIDHITGLLQDLLYCITHPEEIERTSIDFFIDKANDTMSLINSMVRVHVAHTEYVHCSKPELQL